MRTPLAIACAVAVLVLGAYQAIASAALHASATNASLWHVAADATAPLLARVEPSALQAQELRLVLAGAALERGDSERAERFAASLSPGPDRDVAFANVAQARGDYARAVTAFLASGDLRAVQSRVDALVAMGHVDAAIALGAELIHHLERTGAQRDTVAEACYHAGVVMQARAYEERPESDERTTRETQSLGDYKRAVMLAPLEERYRIALANEQLNTNDLAAARAEFERVHDLDPTSVEAFTGLADAAIRANDRATAARYLDEARALAPNSPAVAFMTKKLEP